MQDEIDLLVALHPDLKVSSTTTTTTTGGGGVTARRRLELAGEAPVIRRATRLVLEVDEEAYPAQPPRVVELEGFEHEVATAPGTSTRECVERVWTHDHPGEFCLLQAFSLFAERTETLVQREAFTCHICLDAIEPTAVYRSPACAHCFHTDCFQEWCSTVLESRPIDTAKLRQVVRDKENEMLVHKSRVDALEFQRRELDARESVLRERLKAVPSGTSANAGGAPASASSAASSASASTATAAAAARKAPDAELVDVGEIERRLQELVVARKSNTRERDAATRATAEASEKATEARRRAEQDAIALEKQRTVPCPLCRSEISRSGTATTPPATTLGGAR